MYVRNFKLNGKMIFKIVFVILTILIFKKDLAINL